MITTDIDRLATALWSHASTQSQVVQFYAHAVRSSLQIVAVSPSDQVPADQVAVAISWQLAQDFMSGAENIDEWSLSHGELGAELAQCARPRLHTGSRLEISSVTELDLDSQPVYDVLISINKKRDQVVISWTAQCPPLPIQLYFTRDGDPTVLKATVHLPPDQRTADGKQTVHVHDVSDVSILAANVGLKFSVERKNEIQYVRV